MQKEEHDDNTIIKQINHRLLAKQSNTYKKYIACLRHMDAETKGSIKYPQIH